MSHHVESAIGYANFSSRSHPAVIRVYDEAGNVIGTHEHTGDFKEWRVYFSFCVERLFFGNIATLHRVIPQISR
jgi:hypothetical protein